MTMCINHPDKEAMVGCQKRNNINGYCQQCLEDSATSFDPEIYCKFRTSCIIWEFAKTNGRHRKAINDA